MERGGTFSPKGSVSSARNVLYELEQLSNKAYGLLNRSRQISQNAKDRSFSRKESFTRAGMSGDANQSSFSPQPSLQKTVRRSSSQRNSSLNSTTKKKKKRTTETPNQNKPPSERRIYHQPFADLTNGISPCKSDNKNLSFKKGPGFLRNSQSTSSLNDITSSLLQFKSGVQGLLQQRSSQSVGMYPSPNFKSPTTLGSKGFTMPKNKAVLSIPSILRGLGIENYAEQFAKQEIELEDFFLLKREDLIELKLPIAARNRVLAFQSYFAKNSKNPIDVGQGEKGILKAILKESYNENLINLLEPREDLSNQATDRTTESTRPKCLFSEPIRRDHQDFIEQELPLQPPQQESMEDLRREMLSPGGPLQPRQQQFSTPDEYTLDLRSDQGQRNDSRSRRQLVPDKIIETEEREEESIHQTLCDYREPQERTADFRLTLGEKEIRHQRREELMDHQHQYSDRSLLYCDHSISELNSSQLFQRSQQQHTSPKKIRGSFNFGGNKYLSNKYSRMPRRPSRPPSNMSVQSRSSERGSFFELNNSSPMVNRTLNISQHKSDSGSGSGGRGGSSQVDSSMQMRKQLRQDRSKINQEVKSIMAELQALTNSSRNY